MVNAFCMQASIIDWFTNAAEGMVEAVSNAAATVISFLLAAILDLFTAFLSVVPSVNWQFEAADVTTAITPILAWNSFFPIKEGFVVMGSFMAYTLTFAIIKIVIKLIPTIG